MSDKDDGGSAFPEVFTDLRGDHGDYRYDVYSAGGMSLRDYFAVKALQGLLGNSMTYAKELERQKSAVELDDFMCALSYRYADAMLEARKA